MNEDINGKSGVGFAKQQKNETKNLPMGWQNIFKNPRIKKD